MSGHAAESTNPPCARGLFSREPASRSAIPRMVGHMTGPPPGEIFKAYDIRGLYGEQIDGEVAEQIGRAFASVLSRLAGKPVGDLRVGLGRDMRLSAPELSTRYREGLVGSGAHVIDAGLV